MRSPFRMYPEPTSWWSFADYGCVLSVVQEIGAKTMLEFGPDSSTLTLIEGGATRIDCCEDDPEWATTYRARLETAYPEIVTIVPYEWADPLEAALLPGREYDLALIDGPRDVERRHAVIRYCAARCRYLLVPLEDIQHPTMLRPTVESLGRPVKYIASGALAGTFALVGPAC